MAAARKPLIDKRKFTLAKARFRAWWEGESFDEAAALAAVDAAANDLSGADDELFDPPPFDTPPRLAALGAIWGEGRIRPGEAGDERAVFAALGLSGEGALALLGPGHAAPIATYAEAHPGRIDVFEWREETVEALKYEMAKAKLDQRVSVSRIDIEAHVFVAHTYDALVSIDDFAYCSYPPHLAQQMYKCLKPGGRAAIDVYVGFKAAELATAFASSFAEPQIRAHGDILHFLRDVRLEVVSDEDLTEQFLRLAREGLVRLSENMEAVAKLNVLAAQELAWEVEAWRMRMRLLAQRRLERRRIVVARPPEP
jgi:cyclopropane fatty-acyl-phospholipid synthase-like methyltransferase